MEEIDKVAERYGRRQLKQLSTKEKIYHDYLLKERQTQYKNILETFFSVSVGIRLLEIGAGTGTNIHFFKHAGINPSNIYANELLPARCEVLRANHPDIHILEGNALDISNERKFDVVFQSTVFTSILDDDFRQKLADKMMQLTKPSGIILWYDFIYNNPKNPDVKRVSKSEIRKLFPAATITFHRVTLAPPIGRRIGRFYPFLNLFAFLRTHLIAVIKPLPGIQ
jgi:SAM-dependent methyltransferase